MFIIAEAGVNHNGSLDLARDLVAAAAEAGADAVKFQTFRADMLVTRTAPKAEYQRATTDAEESQYAMLKALELSEEAHHALAVECGHRGIEFMSTPFDVNSLGMLVDRFHLRQIKLPSGEITNGPLLLAAARTGLPIILSTGMSTLGDVEQALGVLAFGYCETDGGAPGLDAFAACYASQAGQVALRDRVTLLHCTSEYPTAFKDVNLRAMDTLASAFGLPVGYSDHTPGIVVPIAAVARGAVVIEKHYTVDRALPGPDHRASLEPDELASMVRAIRDVEAALGSSIKSPSSGEMETRMVARRSLTATAEIGQGDRFLADHIAALRPGTGVSPMQFWDMLTRRSSRSYNPGEGLD